MALWSKVNDSLDLAFHENTYEMDYDITLYAKEKGEMHQPKFLAIADCARSRTLAGERWMQAFLKHQKEHRAPYFIPKQDETFKFGGEKLYPSRSQW